MWIVKRIARMNLKYVIYGAGKRGKEALELIGKEQVDAFVDSNEEMVGGQYCGLPIIDIDSLETMKEQVICVISPLKQTEEIMSVLEHRNVHNYILFKAVDLMVKECKGILLEKISRWKMHNKVGICGVSISSLMLYAYLEGESCEPTLIATNRKEYERYLFLNNFYRIELFEKGMENFIDIIYTEGYLENHRVQKINNRRLLNIKDIYEQSLCSDELLLKYKNLHKGKRCFIVATGPSLKIEDLETLEKHREITISMNRIYNLFNKTTWRPNYYMIHDLKMIEDLRETIATMDLQTKFVSRESKEFWEQGDIRNCIGFNWSGFIEMGQKAFFSNKVDKCIYEGFTVTYACIQMAIYMGFKEIYLLGVDHKYSKDLYEGKNHFEGYDADKKVRLNAVYIEQNELSYKCAKEYAQKYGIKIFNATRGGKLEVFERVDFDSLFMQR